MEENQKPQTTNLTAGNHGFTQGAVPEHQNAMRMQSAVNSVPSSTSPSGTPTGAQQQHQQPQIGVSPGSSKMPPNMKQAECNWTQEHYSCLRDWLEKGISGEEIMQRCGIQRRKELLARVQVVSQREKKFFDLQWDAPSFLEEGKRALPPIKVSSDGSLRISKERLTRMGLTFPPGATFKLKKFNPTVLVIEHML